MPEDSTSDRSRYTPRAHIVCQRCGVEFTVNAARAGTAKFCSRACKYGESPAKSCPQCGKDFRPQRSQYEMRVYCSVRCKGIARRVERRLDEGYVVVWDGDRQIDEHRLVMERILGRSLSPHEHVHHKNEDTLDNRPENLEVLTRSQHMSLHRRTQSQRVR